MQMYAFSVYLYTLKRRNLLFPTQVLPILSILFHVHGISFAISLGQMKKNVNFVPLKCK